MLNLLGEITLAITQSSILYWTGNSLLRRDCKSAVLSAPSDNYSGCPTAADKPEKGDCCKKKECGWFGVRRMLAEQSGTARLLQIAADQACMQLLGLPPFH